MRSCIGGPHTPGPFTNAVWRNHRKCRITHGDLASRTDYRREQGSNGMPYSRGKLIIAWLPKRLDQFGLAPVENLRNFRIRIGFRSNGRPKHRSNHSTLFVAHKGNDFTSNLDSKSVELHSLLNPPRFCVRAHTLPQQEE